MGAREAEVARYLGFDAELEWTLELPHGSLELWRSRIVNSMFAGLYVAPLGGYFRIDESHEALERALRESGVPLSDSPTIAELIDGGPGARRVAVEILDVPKQHRETDWLPSMRDDGSWVGYCNDYDHGAWERVVVTKDRRVTFERVGSGYVLRKL